MKKKKCFKCGKIKYLDEFYSHPDMADDHLNKCKECTKKEAIENRNKNIEYYRDYDKKRYENDDRKEALKESKLRRFLKNPIRYVENERKSKSKWGENNPEKRYAQGVVNNAIRDGKLIKEPCEVCGSMDVEAHYDDYSKPLGIRWLCPKHHGEFHRLQRR